MMESIKNFWGKNKKKILIGLGILGGVAAAGAGIYIANNNKPDTMEEEQTDQNEEIEA